ncbi:MAG TPA: RluA family pseudouridine synthase [Solirubrobacteraceae bacterium]|nr:RluA family pseudouridine synthase [Solirubrobacteraceae bacterium]
MAEIEWEGTVGDDAAGQRLDQFLAEPLGSRARAARLIGAGLVRLDGRTVQKRRLVNVGEQVVVTAETLGQMPESDPAHPSSADFTVAYEDDALIVVDKPAGVVVHPARGHEGGTLAQALAGRAAGGEDPYRAGIVHRLDRDTSGLLVIAKSDAVHRALKDLLQARLLSREYLTLVDGIPPAHSGTIDAPIGRDRRERLLHSIDTDAPREARTHFELLEPLRHEALLRVSLETGRTHQIRVHMRAIGHPVLGDSAYGGPARFGLERQFLHAARLAFPHPLTGDAIDVSSPLPADLQAALELARAEAA